MLSDAPAHATLPAQDLERAKRFYGETLGLTPERELPGGVFYSVGNGTRFLVYPAAGQASGAHTQLGFRVDDIRSEVDALLERGVSFEEYDDPKTEDGVATMGDVRAAWFKDSEGNTIGIVQLP
jgi:catechol 2,3-dioxygenase-like lactoylglutathione lyase family enzyme